MKDYNPRVPFGQKSRPLQRAAPSPFMPPTLGLQRASIALNTVTYSSASNTSPPAHVPSSVVSKNTLEALPLQYHLSNQISGDHTSRLKGQSTISSSVPYLRETIDTRKKWLKDIAGEASTNLYYDQNRPSCETSSAHASAPLKVSNQVVLTSSPLEAPRAHSSSSGQSSDRTRTRPLHSLSTAGTTAIIGVKRRLGMGRSTTGYSNKKFKPPA